MFKEYTDQGEVGCILLETHGDGSKNYVDVQTFETLFNDVEKNPTYEALSGTHSFILGDTRLTMTAAEMGYQKYFDQWKMQGII